MDILKRAIENGRFSRLKSDPSYGACLAYLKNVYAQSKCEPLEPLTREDRALFEKTGSREAFEHAYFRRRKYLTAAALLALVYPEEEHYLKESEMLIENTCAEYSWALPAHTAGMKEAEAETFIDLFAAETGQCLCEILALLKDRLRNEIQTLAEREVKRRVIHPFLHRTFWWEKEKSNWAAVCAGGVCSAFFYLAPHLYDEIAPRIHGALECFLCSFPDDGACLEGFYYWHYGFGEFIWFADLLYAFTEGKENYFTDKKVQAAAEYIQKCFLLGDATVSFSDGTQCGKADSTLLYYLSAHYPERVRSLPERLQNFSANNGGWLQLSRMCLYYDPTRSDGTLARKDYFLPHAGQAILNRKSYSLAVKAGHNAEPHNHNDVGSFILSTVRGQVVADLGAAVYTRQYFDEKTRYGILCNSSRGHSVPIVNGKYEQAGKAFYGTIDCTQDTVTVNFASAYGQERFTKLCRSFFCKEDRLTMEDCFEADYESLTERFILLSEPVIKADCVLAENLCIRFDPQKTKPILSWEQHLPHGENTERTVYLLDFPLKKGLSSIRFLFEIL